MGQWGSLSRIAASSSAASDTVADVRRRVEQDSAVIAKGSNKEDGAAGPWTKGGADILLPFTVRSTSAVYG